MLEIIVIIIFIIVLAAAFTGLFGTFIKNKSSSGSQQAGSQELDADQIITKAMNLYEMGQITKAINILEDLTKKQPDNINALFLLGDYLFEKSLPSKAEKYYKQILKISPNSKDAYEKIADCNFLIGKFDKAAEGYKIVLKGLDSFEIREKLADSYLKMNNAEQAIIEYRTILSKDVYNTQVKKKLGDLFFSRGEYKRAISEYEDIIKTDGANANNINILKRIAKANCQLAKYVDAALVYKKIIEIKETDVSAYKELAELYEETNSLEKAARVYLMMIDRKLDVSPEIMAKLPDIYLNLGDYERAISEGSKILSENPQCVYLLETIGEAYRKLENYEKAILNFKKYIEEEPNENNTKDAKTSISFVLCDWGNQFFKENDFQGALDKYIEAIQYDEANPEIYINLGKTNSKIKNYDTAIAHFKKGLELSGFEPEVYGIIAKFYEELEEHNSVIELYYDAVKKHPENYKLRGELGVSLAKAGFYPQAESELSTALTINPESPELYFYLGKVYEYQKRFEDAKINYKKALELDPGFSEAKKSVSDLLKQE